MLGQAIKNAAAGGNSDAAEYLKLKAQNDAVREAGVRWLFESLIAIATDRPHALSGVAVERIEPHNFAYEHSNIAGSLIRIRYGVRCLTLEAGWTRTPADGFMRGGSLAIARIVHFGMPRNNSDLMLVRSADSAVWNEVTAAGDPMLFDSERLQRHFDVFLST